MKYLVLLTVVISALGQERCRSPEVTEGICSLIDDCPFLRDIPFNSLKEFIRGFGGCGRRNGNLALCCPVSWVSPDAVPASPNKPPQPASPNRRPVPGSGSPSDAKHVVCYFSSWAVNIPGYGRFDVDDIDPFLCTQLIFRFAGLSNHTWEIEVLDPWNELCPHEEGGNNCAFDRFVALKDINPDLTVLLAIGGWNEYSVDYSAMAADPQKRDIFIRSTVKLVQKHKFDGLDFDWEYPASRGGVRKDKNNFITLLRRLRAAFDAADPSLMMTAVVSAERPTLEDAYHIPEMSAILDQIHLKSFYYHGAWEKFTGHNAPLCNHYRYNDDEILKEFNVIFSVNYYLDHGVPPEKLIMGIPTYGRCFTLDNINDHGLFAPASSEPDVTEPRFNEICERMRSKDCSVVNDPCLHEPYFYCQEDKIWCSFDDADSVREKARFAKNMGLGGIYIPAIDSEDFHPRCYDEAFHLIHTIKRAVNAPADGDLPVCKCDQPPTTEAPTTDPTTSTTPSLTPSNAPPTTSSLNVYRSNYRNES